MATKRLIDAIALIADLELLAKFECDYLRSVVLGIVYTIKQRPTVDAVEVVRCKDCEHSKANKIIGENRVQLHCMMCYGFPCVDPDEYCSRGERKGNV